MSQTWNRAAHRTLSIATFFGLLLGSIWLSIWAAEHVHESLVASGVTLGVGALVMVLSHFWAFNDDWRGWRSALGVDLLHTLVSTISVSALVEAALFGVMFEVARQAQGLVGWSFWPGLPLPLAIFIGVVIADFGFYWSHRMMHRVEKLWPVHEVHHSSDKMYVLAASRNHPLNTMITYTAQVAPLVLLGAPVSVLLGVSVAISVLGIIQHSNLNLRLGALDWVFCTPKIHRLHHSIDEWESNHNYSSNLTLWDHLFGTYMKPERSTRVVGVDGWASGEPNFWRHLAHPFRRKVDV